MRTVQPWMRHRTHHLNADLSEPESRLWFHLCRNQVHGLSCYRQRAISTFVVDFYLPAVKLVIEVDGGQHYCIESVREDAARCVYLRSLGLTVIRFSNLQVLNEIESVLEDIYEVVGGRLAGVEIARFAGQQVAAVDTGEVADCGLLPG